MLQVYDILIQSRSNPPAGEAKRPLVMKERVTFVHAPGAGVDPALIDVQDAGLLGPAIVTTREDRLSVPLNELPSELSEFLGQVASLNVKWVSPVAYDTVDPFSSRVSPGLHVSYTPLGDTQKDP